MKIITTILLGCLVYSAQGQTVSPLRNSLGGQFTQDTNLCRSIYLGPTEEAIICPNGFDGKVFMYLLDRLDSLTHAFQTMHDSLKRLDKLENKIDSLEARPYLFIDLNKQQPGVWLTNKEGEYMWYIAPINIK